MPGKRQILPILIVWILLLSACTQTPARIQVTPDDHQQPTSRTSAQKPTTDTAGSAGDAAQQTTAAQSTQTPRPRQGPIAPGTSRTLLREREGVTTFLLSDNGPRLRGDT